MAAWVAVLIAALSVVLNLYTRWLTEHRAPEIDIEFVTFDEDLLKLGLVNRGAASTYATDVYVTRLTPLDAIKTELTAEDMEYRVKYGYYLEGYYFDIRKELGYMAAGQNVLLQLKLADSKDVIFTPDEPDFSKLPFPGEIVPVDAVRLSIGASVRPDFIGGLCRVSVQYADDRALFETAMHSEFRDCLLLFDLGIAWSSYRIQRAAEERRASDD